MKLKYDFPPKVRLLYLYHTACFLCGSNGSDCGGLEIHHILGRVSDSAFNSSCLCRCCHAKMVHNQQEHREVFAHTFEFLRSSRLRGDFLPTEYDWWFLEKHLRELTDKLDEPNAR